MRLYQHLMAITVAAFYVGRWGIVAALLIKAHWMNNLHATLREDPIEMWLALAVAYILISQCLQTHKKGAP